MHPIVQFIKASKAFAYYNVSDGGWSKFYELKGNFEDAAIAVEKWWKEYPDYIKSIYCDGVSAGVILGKNAVSNNVGE